MAMVNINMYYYNLPMEKEKSLIFRIILVYILLTLSVYMVLYVVAVRYMDAFVKETARQTADGISKQVFSSMYQVMKGVGREGTFLSL